MLKHSVVRALQLAISISIVATAAFLLHYRTQSHSNFTNEPLVSCITGAAAFIYALWAILSHRRQPDDHKWTYLHGLGCLVVCGLLIAGSTLAFIYSKQGILCERFRDLKNQTPAGSVNDSTGNGDWGDFVDNMTAKRDLPQYKDGEQYAPGALCENIYEDMDRACGVLGAFAAILWLLDFCLIFGFCDSSGRHGPHRNPRRRRRGQVQPDDIEDCYAAGEIIDRTSRRQSQGNKDIPQDEHCNNFNQRKQEVHWLEQRASNDPKQHVQGPISSSMLSSAQQTQLASVDVSAGSPTASRRPLNTLIHSSSGDAHQHETRLMAANIQPLSPPPLPRTKWEQPPDSPTLTKPSQQQPRQQVQDAVVSGVPSAADALTIPVLLTGPVTPPFMTTCRRPEQLPQVQEPSILDTPESEGRNSSSRASSPRSQEPVCYASDSSQREYFPIYMNIPARIEQPQQGGTSRGSGPGSGVSATSFNTTIARDLSTSRRDHSTRREE